MEQPRKVNKFLDTYSLPRLNQGEADDLNRPITRRKIEFITTTTTKKKPSKQKSKNGQLHRGIVANI